MPDAPAEKPRWIILHGEDEFSRDEELGRLRAALRAGDPAMADLNTSVLDGAKLTFGELRHACDSIPFMAEQRLVIVHGLLGRLSGGGRRGEDMPAEADPAWKRAFRDELMAYLPALPPTTRLVFVEPSTLPAAHPVLKHAQEQKAMQAFPLPKDSSLPGWIVRHATALGGQISREAAELLSGLIGPDTRLLDSEIYKLLLYVDGERPVGVDDVRGLVSRAREANVFDLVDCVGRGETDKALRLLHYLLADEGEPLYILSMLARQIRILIQVAELNKQGLVHPEIVGRLKLHPFVVTKALDQIKNYQLARLEEAHRRVLEADLAIKTGRLEPMLALDLLVVRLGERQGPPFSPNQK